MIRGRNDAEGMGLKQPTKTKRMLLMSSAGIAVVFAIYCCFAPVAVVYGPRVMKQCILVGWANQRSRLNWFQKRALYQSLTKEREDVNTALLVVPVLNAHLREDEPEIVRQLVWTAFATDDPYVCATALAGLKNVSQEHRDIAIATFLFHLENSDADKKNNWEKIVFCISGLKKFSCTNAMTKIQALTKHPSKSVSGVARKAVEEWASKGSKGD